MPPAVVALFFATGLATWVFTKVQRTTGGNTQNSTVVAAIAGIFGFIALLLILNTIDKMLS